MPDGSTTQVAARVTSVELATRSEGGHRIEMTFAPLMGVGSTERCAA